MTDYPDPAYCWNIECAGCGKKAPPRLEWRWRSTPERYGEWVRRDAEAAPVYTEAAGPDEEA